MPTTKPTFDEAADALLGSVDRALESGLSTYRAHRVCSSIPFGVNVTNAMIARSKLPSQQRVLAADTDAMVRGACRAISRSLKIPFIERIVMMRYDDNTHDRYVLVQYIIPKQKRLAFVNAAAVLFPEIGDSSVSWIDKAQLFVTKTGRVMVISAVGDSAIRTLDDWFLSLTTWDQYVNLMGTEPVP